MPAAPWSLTTDDPDVRITLGDLAMPADIHDEDITCAEVDLLFKQRPAMQSVIVRALPECLALTRSGFYQALTGPRGYGWSLFYRRPVRSVVVNTSRVLDAAADAVLTALQLLREGQGTSTDDVVVRSADGAVATLPIASLYAELSRWHEGRALHLARSDRRFRALIASISDVVVVLDREARVRYVSPSAQQVTGGLPGERQGTDALGLVHPDDAVSLGRLLARCLSTPGTEVHGQFRMTVADGRLRRFELRGRNLLDDDAIRGIVVTYRDVTDQHELAGQLHHQAFHDSLTGLPNRALFLDRLGHAHARLARGRSRVAVVFGDLDGFKFVNDQFGHGAGDAVLIEVAQRFRDGVRTADTLARLGGDEFAVLVEDVIDDADVAAVADRLLAALARPVRIGNQDITIGVSLGIAFVDPQEPPEEAVRRADAAMYVAKGAGKGMAQPWSKDLHDQLHRRQALVGDLRGCGRRGELLLEYQPLVEVATGAVRGVEALLRWDHPQLGRIPPNEFIPLAEEHAVIAELGSWALEAACRTVSDWADADGRPVALSVNVSASQLTATFPSQVAAVLVTTGLRADRLELEITESALLPNLDATLPVLEALRSLGVRLAIDDFGTGYSSLAYLRRLPIHTLKLDKSFVDRLTHSPSDVILVDGLTRLAHSLGLSVTAEGIEQDAQLEVLAELGCDLAQGYLFSRPVPANAAVELLGRHLPASDTTKSASRVEVPFIVAGPSRS